MRSRVWLVACLLFGSGFCALVYQIGWLRDFRLIFGGSTAASAAVLAIFIGGLGAGGLLLGPRADNHPRPLLFYALLETIVAISAAATPFLLTLVRTIYLASGGSARLGMTVATVARLLLSALVLLVPTFAMGGTLPAAARAVTRDSDVRRQDVAALYAFNTLGAVVGCLAATFWLLEIVGTRSTLWLAAAINLLVAMVARQVDRSFFGDVRLKADATPANSVRLKADATSAPVVSGFSRTEAHPAPSTPHPAPVWFVLVAACVVGFAFFLMELVWYRMLGPLLGGSVFTFGLVLAVALAGIGAGGLLYALVAGDKRASLSGFGWTCLIEAALVAATYALGDRIAVLTLALVSLKMAVGFVGQIAGWTIVTAIVVLPPALVAGFQFPLLIALFGQGRTAVGRQIGLVYAANTIGAIAGSLAGGFGFLPWLSAPGAWRFVAIVLVLLGAIAAVLSVVMERGVGSRFRLVPQSALVVATILLVAATGPTAVWRHGGIGAGRSPSDVLASPTTFQAWASAEQRAIVWEGDGVESSVALMLDPHSYAFIVNGKSDGNARGDADMQVMLGLVGAIANPAARRALVIGLGTGSTAGWLAAIPSMDHVEVAELEPLILEVAKACAPVNRDVLANPKVHVTIGDAREMLLTSRDRYGLIASEPSNPFRAGIASLYTVEYYRAAADRLTDDGVFAQWVQSYEIDARTLRAIYATLAAVFPQIDTWQTSRGDLILVGSKRPRTYSLHQLSRIVGEEPFKSALAHAWRAVDVNGLFAHYVANTALAHTIARMPSVDINTDDRNVVEFGLARSVGRSFIITDMRTRANALGVGRPPLDKDDVRWPEVETAWISYNAYKGVFAGLQPQGPPNEQARQTALLKYYEREDVAGAREAWHRQSEPPRDPTELAMAADFEANVGSEAALPFIDQLRAYEPGEADVVLATLRFNQSRHAEAAAALEAALTRFRTDPWPALRYKQGAIDLAQLVANRDPSVAARMFAALGQPFSVRSLDDARLIARALLTRLLDFRATCGTAIGALEPHAPWADNFLRLRRDCYEATGDARLAVATRDLQEFLDSIPQPIVAR